MATTKFLDLDGLTKYNEKIKAYADSKASSAASGVSVTATTTGSGNAVTSVTASGKTITVTKGTTFLTSHQDISGKADKNIISANNTYTSSNTVESAINAVVTSVNNHTASKSNPHSVTKAQVGLGNVTNESKATMFTSAALTGTPTAPTAASGTNTTQIATTAFVQSALGVATSQALVFMGTVPTTGLDTTTNLPKSPKVGDTYVIDTAGTYASQVCEVGDTVICTKALDEAPATWLVVQKNIDGAVTTTSTLTANTVMLGNGNKAIKNLANGSNGQFLKLVNGTPTWAADNNTTYAAGTGISLSGTTFSNSGVRSVTGSNATLTVNTGGTSSTITINNVAKATEADNAGLAAVASSIMPTVGTGSSLLLGSEDTDGNYVVSTLLTPSSGVYSMTVSKATSATSATSATTASKVTNALTVKDYSGTTAYTYNGSAAVTISAITESEITALFA